MIVGSGWPPGPKGPKIGRAGGDRKQDDAGKEDVLPHRIWHERLAVSDASARRNPADRSSRRTTRPGIGHSLIPSFSTSRTCNATKAISSPGITKTCIAKKRESVAPAMIGPPSTRFTSQGPISGTRLTIDAPMPKSPIGILVEAHHLSRETHAERHQEQEDAEYPGQLTRKLVSAEEEDLRHVDQDNGDHEIRTPAMQRPNEPSERDAVIESLQAVPGLSRGRHIDQRQQNSGDDLK